VAERA
jgi:retron-type reverse transcriptase